MPADANAPAPVAATQRAGCGGRRSAPPTRTDEEDEQDRHVARDDPGGARRRSCIGVAVHGPIHSKATGRPR